VCGSHGEMTGHEIVDGGTQSPGVMRIGVLEGNVYIGFGYSG